MGCRAIVRIPVVVRIAFAVWIGVGTSLLTARASFADEAETETARALFKQGVELFEKGDFVGALEQFEKADRARHAAAITYNIGRARESIGRVQGAIDAYEAYLAEAGPQGEFTSAATMSIAQLKARSTRLRVESDPPGATLRVDGVLIEDKTPATVLVFRGRHHVSVQLGEWEEGRDFDAEASGAIADLRFTRPKVRAQEKAPQPKQTSAQPVRPEDGALPSKTHEPVLSGLTGGVGLALFYYSFVNRAEETTATDTTSSNARAKGVVFGLTLEVGYALSTSTALMLRGFGGLGSSEKDLATLGVGGLMATTRLTRRAWLGAGAVVGGSRANADASKSIAGMTSDATITYRTDIAVGPMIELSYVLGENEDGQWLVSTYPGLLLSTGPNQSTLFFPLVVGHRWF